MHQTANGCVTGKIFLRRRRIIFVQTGTEQCACICIIVVLFTIDNEIRKFNESSMRESAQRADAFRGSGVAAKQSRRTILE